jgi:ribosomal protein L44E
MEAEQTPLALASKNRTSNQKSIGSSGSKKPMRVGNKQTKQTGLAKLHCVVLGLGDVLTMRVVVVEADVVVDGGT